SPTRNWRWSSIPSTTTPISTCGWRPATTPCRSAEHEDDPEAPHRRTARPAGAGLGTARPLRRRPAARMGAAGGRAARTAGRAAARAVGQPPGGPPEDARARRPLAGAHPRAAQARAPGHGPLEAHDPRAARERARAVFAHAHPVTGGARGAQARVEEDEPRATARVGAGASGAGPGRLRPPAGPASPADARRR